MPQTGIANQKSAEVTWGEKYVHPTPHRHTKNIFENKVFFFRVF